MNFSMDETEARREILFIVELRRLLGNVQATFRWV
jgi:hypothetical protein